jgi:triphosphatase
MRFKMALTPREIELKLEVDPTDIARIKYQLSRLSLSKPVARTLVSVYFDTVRWSLRKHGLSLRVRRVGRQYVQTVKCAGGPATGLYDRAEWEHPTRGSQPELSWTAETPLGPLLHGKLGESLRPLFETRIRRTEYRLERSGAMISAVVDHGAVHAGRRRSGIYELELALLKGSAGALFSMAKALGHVVPMHLSIKTKAERGYELLQKTGSAAQAPQSVQASPTATAGEAFQTIARGCLRQLIASEKAVLASDREALHRMRIALRRLQASLSVFAGVVGDREAARIKTEIRWIGKELGPARDVDVFIADVVDPLRRRYRHDRGVTNICRNFNRHRAFVYGQVAASLRSERFRHLELELARWIEAGRWVKSRRGSASLRRDRPVTPLAAEALTRRRKKLRKTGRRLAELNHRDRHRLRIRGKKLRYTMQFFSGLFPGKKRARRCRDTLSTLKDLQDSLGALHDLARREVLSSHSTQATRPEGRPLTGSAAIPKAFVARVSFAAQKTHVTELMHEAESAFRRFCAIKPFWR